MAARGAGIQLERVAGAFKLHLVGDDLHTGLARHRQLLTYIYIDYTLIPTLYLHHTGLHSILLCTF